MQTHVVSINAVGHLLEHWRGNLSRIKIGARTHRILYQYHATVLGAVGREVPDERNPKSLAAHIDLIDNPLRGTGFARDAVGAGLQFGSRAVLYDTFQHLLDQLYRTLRANRGGRHVGFVGVYNFA